MSIGPTVPASIAGLSLAQVGATQSERSHEAGARQMRAALDLKSESAAGVGTTDGEEHAAGERDADGRRLWEAPLGRRQTQSAQGDEASDETSQSGASPASDELLGQELDLSG